MRGRWIAGILAGLCLACSPEAREPSASETPLWARSTAEPYPFVTPIPPLEATALDGTYARVVPERVAGDSVACRRCAPYRVEVGRTTLVLEEGRYFIGHEAPNKPMSSQFSSRGHFTLSGDRLVLFNDSSCPTTEGHYRWSLAGGRLELGVVKDPCPFSQLRSRFLTATRWPQG